jgi:hypothetical protein
MGRLLLLKPREGEALRSDLAFATLSFKAVALAAAPGRLSYPRNKLDPRTKPARELRLDLLLSWRDALDMCFPAAALGL